MRWATVIENVLKIMKPPTNRAIPAKASSAVVMNLKLLFTSRACCWAWACAVRTVTPAGRAARRRPTTVRGGTPGWVRTSMPSTWPGWPATRWASGSVSTATLAPASESTLPYLAAPTSRKRWSGALPETAMRSPRCQPWSWTVCRSSPTSPGARGGRPWT